MSADTKMYYGRYRMLRQALGEVPGVFSELSPIAQWELFGYYIPHERVGGVALALHRFKMEARYPGIGAHADEAYLKVRTRVHAWRHHATGAGDHRLAAQGRIPWQVLERTNPKPDLVRLSEALMERADEIEFNVPRWWEGGPMR